jgi:hypothetical protein
MAGEFLLMRHAWVPEGAIRDQRLSDGDNRVYSYLLVLANKNGYCKVKGSTIAKDLGKARTTIIFHLNRLIELGYVTKSPTFHADGGSGPNEYWVARDGITPVSIGLTPPCQHSGHPGVNKLSTGGVNKLSTPMNIPIEQKKTPSHAREGSFSLDEKDDASQSNSADREAARQPSLLLPIAGTRALDAQSGASAFDDWRPDDQIAAWAAANVSELSNPLDPKIVDRFKDHWRVKGRIPADFAADYRKWLSDEPHFAKLRGEPHLAASSGDKVMAYFLNESREADDYDE